MTAGLFSRYERDAAGELLIDVAAGRVEDLYNRYDRTAPYVRRDLDAELVDYLIDCARELSPRPFAIRFILGHALDAETCRRIQGSVSNFFHYMMELERRNIRRMLNRSGIFFCIGIAILFCSVWLNRLLGEERSVVANVFAEGLTIAAWVSLWEALATFLIEWFPHRRMLGLYRRLAQARLLFRSDPAGAAGTSAGARRVAGEQE